MKRGYSIAGLLSGVMMVLITAAAAAGTTTINATVPLSVYDIVIDEITASGATVQWTTNTAATSLIFYDTTPHDSITEYTCRSVPDFSQVTGHLQILTGLASNTLYYLRTASTAVVDSKETVAVSPEYAFTTLAAGSSGGGGGGGGGGTVTTTTSGGGIEGTAGIAFGLTGLTAGENIVLNSLGQTQNAFSVTSADENCTIDVLKSTYLRDAFGKPLTALSAVPVTEPPAAPDNEVIVAAYDFGPDGARFNPALNITFHIASENLPEHAVPEDVRLAVWEDNSWQILDCTYDTDAGTLTASVAHFCQFAILAPIPDEEGPAAAATTNLPLNTPTTTSAIPDFITAVSTDITQALEPVTVTVTTFAGTGLPTEPGKGVIITMSELAVSPSRVKPGETVCISFLIAGTGITEETYTVDLKINEITESSRTLTIPNDEVQRVSFIVSKELPGEYRVDVGGLAGRFTVMKSHRELWLWWALAGGIVTAALAILWLKKRGRYCQVKIIDNTDR